MASTPAPSKRFEDLPPALHREIVSNLQAHEALAAGATSHEMQTLILANITRLITRPQLLFDYAPKEKLSTRDWEAYLDRHGSSLARLLARLPFLKVLSECGWQRSVVHRTILLQPCPQLANIELDEILGRISGLPSKPPELRGSAEALLHSAMARGHLPSWERLQLVYVKDYSNIIEAARAGHLSHVKELVLDCEGEGESLQLQVVLQAFQAYDPKLETLTVGEGLSNMLATRQSMLELFSSPMFSSVRKLQDSSVLFVSGFLRSAGAGGRPSLRELHFGGIWARDDFSCLADALLLQGNKNSAPNLETLSLCSVQKAKIAQLGSHLFARGALSTLTSLEFVDVAFDEESMISLMDGFRRSGHEGRILKRLVFGTLRKRVAIGRKATSGISGLSGSTPCPRNRSRPLPFPHQVSLALIEGLRDGLFPNLQELSALHGGMLVQQVAELVEVMRGGAPCAQTLRKVVIKDSQQMAFLVRVPMTQRHADFEALRAVLPRAFVSLM